MFAVALALIGNRNEPPVVTVFMTLIVGVVVTAVILWQRRYRRVWEQTRAQNWPQGEGRFFSGEVVPLLTGRSQRVAAFEIQMRYQYEAGRTLTGTYKRVFPTKEAAEAFIKRLDGQRVSVRIANGRPSLSCVLDKDVDGWFRLPS